MSLLVGQCLFDEKENKLDSCRREDCVEELCKKLKNGAMKIINYEKKEMTPLTYEENKEQEAFHICEEKFCMDRGDENIKIEKRLKTTVITQENLEDLVIANAT